MGEQGWVSVDWSQRSEVTLARMSSFLVYEGDTSSGPLSSNYLTARAASAAMVILERPQEHLRLSYKAVNHANPHRGWLRLKCNMPSFS